MKAHVMRAKRAYSSQDLEAALKRLYPSTDKMLKGGIKLLPLCEMVAVVLFIDYDNWSEEIQACKDRVLLRKALNDLQNGKFIYES